MTQTLFSPDRWLETTVRGIKDYVRDRVNTNIYDVVMEYPDLLSAESTVPHGKTMIHFEIDMIDTEQLGFSGAFDGAWVHEYSVDTGDVTPKYAARHLVNFDVGIWSWDRSGGITARLRARQLLHTILGLPQSGVSLRDATDGGDGGIQVMSFTGGRFITDRINDVPTYRMVDSNLNVLVFSRATDIDIPAIGDIYILPELTIDDSVPIEFP